MNRDDECGIAVLCALDGTVQRVLRDDLNLGGQVPTGSQIADLADAGARDKMAAFLVELASRQAAFDWEINVPIDGALTKLHFAGTCADDAFLVVAARTRAGLARLQEDTACTNVQANAMRMARKPLALQSEPQADRADSIFDDLSKVNNELANMQRELARKNAELKKLNEQKNFFIGMAAHDLRSPLSVILSYSEFLESEAVLSDEQRAFLAIIRGSCQFMRRLIDDLLLVSQIEAGRLVLDLQPVDLAQLLGRNVALNRVLAARKSVAIELGIQQGLPVMQADSGKIEQVMNNLIGNAVKFTSPGKSVTVRAFGSADGVTIAVKDQGPGIPDTALPRLFKPFGEAGVRATTGEKGTGLGLAIVRRIVEGHGGGVTVESQVGTGSTFTVKLPLKV